MSEYYRVCENCGAALDPGERCECRKMEQTEQPEKIRYIDHNRNKEVKAV